MRDTVRILQAGDLHLGTAFSGSGFPMEKARKRRRELLGTFRRLCETARERSVDVLLLVGDVFEAEWVSEAEVAEVRQLLGQLSIPVFISPGNHDPLMEGSPYEWGEWPANVHLFRGMEGADGVELPDLPLTVHGYGYQTKWVRDNPLQGLRARPDGRLHVVMVHGSYDAPDGTPYWPIKREDVLAMGADYVAFGHYHQPQILIESSGLVQAAYAGSLEPLGYDETGEHGALLLEVGKGGARLEWLPLAQRRYHTLAVDVEGCASLLDVAARIQTAIPAGDQGRDLLDIELTGAVEPSLWLDRDDLLERVGHVAYHLRLTDRTHPDIDSDAYAPASAAGRFVAKMRDKLAAETDERKRRVLERALALGLLAYERGKVAGS